MAIKIQIDQPTAIPIEFGDVELSFPMDDHAMERIAALSTVELTEKWKLVTEAELTSETLSEVMDEIRSILKELYDTLMGEGTFDLLYDQYASVITLVEGFFVLIEEIPNEIQAYHKKVEKKQKDKLDKLRQKRK